VPDHQPPPSDPFGVRLQKPHLPVHFQNGHLGDDGVIGCAREIDLRFVGMHELQAGQVDVDDAVQKRQHLHALIAARVVDQGDAQFEIRWGFG
jgi:hypothetical protein